MDMPTMEAMIIFNMVIGKIINHAKWRTHERTIR